MTLTASFPTEDASGNPIDDTRRIFGGMVTSGGDGTPRLGVIDPDPSTPLVTGTTSMAYLIKGDVTFVTQRDSSTGGVELSANDAVASVATTTAPVANSRIDVIWIKCQFDAYGDSGLYAPTFGVTQGTADASPSVPSVPTGATALAHAEVTSTDTTTETVVITQVAPFTAMAGGVVPVRNSTELAAWEPGDGAIAYRLDNDVSYQRVAGSWEAITWEVGTFTPASGVTAGSNNFLRRLGDTVELNLHVSPTTGDWDTSTTVTTLPAGWRPGSAMSFVHQSFNAGFAQSVNIGTINTNGTVVVNQLAVANQIIARGMVRFKVA